MDDNDNTDQPEVKTPEIDIDWGKVKAYIKRLGPVSILVAIAASMPAIGGFVLLGILTLFIQ